MLGEVGRKYGLYTKITGGQRIDLFGARVEQLPAIWQEAKGRLFVLCAVAFALLIVGLGVLWVLVRWLEKGLAGI